MAISPGNLNLFNKHIIKPLIILRGQLDLFMYCIAQ